MPLPKKFPTSPYAVLDPDHRWMPDLENNLQQLALPPLVAELRRKVKAFRDADYKAASATSRSLLKWWFQEAHFAFTNDGTSRQFQYYFAQREALETSLYLHDVVKAQDPHDLLQFSAKGTRQGNLGDSEPTSVLTAKDFDESWRRYVIKMATGSGKTKVMSLAIAWSYFHKLYEPDSDLARNFLVIAPNIIVLDRLYRDFQELRIFSEDPILPTNGYDGHNWQDDFQLTVHKQDEVSHIRPLGNIFLTNIQRVYCSNEILPTSADENSMEYFLGSRPVTKTNDSKIDLGVIVRDLDELMILNDEAHHIHDKKLAWFQSIKDIHNRLVQRGKKLSLQLDLTATPKHNNGTIFVQTVSDYPLVEAIAQNVVKHPTLPDDESRAKLIEGKSSKFTEKYADYLNLGILEWRKAYAEHKKTGKKAILFVMTDNTRNCDDVAKYLEQSCLDLKDAVLVIHTKENGDISEVATGKDKEELERLRNLSNNIDALTSPYKAIVSVLMLKEGWDVRNVTTIVGLRSYSSKANILPEQTLGRGLRKMYSSSILERVSVIGTNAFMDFVEKIEAEGVVLERMPMGNGVLAKQQLLVEIDKENKEKDLDTLDIEIPLLTPRVYREYQNLENLDVATFTHEKIPYRQFSKEEQRKIVFRDITTNEITHITELDNNGIADYRSVIGYFAQTIMRQMRLVSGYDVLYEKMESFIRKELFTKPVDLENPNTLRNLSEVVATRTILETFKKAINALTVKDRGSAEICGTIKISDMRPFMVNPQECLENPKKSLFNRIVGDSHFELFFAEFLERCPDIIAYATNYFAVHFRLDYVNADGDISNYYPDFFVKLSKNKIVIVETKGREDLDDPLKLARLRQWCADVNTAQQQKIFDFIFVDQENFETYPLKNFQELLDTFRKYKKT